MSLNAVFSVTKEPALAPCEAEEKLSVAVLRANEVAGTDVKALESIHLPHHCQEADLLQSGWFTRALHPKPWDFISNIVSHSWWSQPYHANENGK